MPYQIRLRPGALAVMNSLDSEERSAILDALQQVGTPPVINGSRVRTMKPLRGEPLFALDGLGDLRVIFTNPAEGVIEVQDVINRELATLYG